MSGIVRPGPVDPAHGFPLWYRDARGEMLGLVLTADEPAPDPTAPLSVPDNFPEEAFYLLVESEATIGTADGTGSARLVVAMEAAFGGLGVPADGQQMVFGRIRFRVRDGVPESTYTARHPWGEISGATDERGRMTVTQDIGSPGDPRAALTSPVAAKAFPRTETGTLALGDGTVSGRLVVDGVPAVFRIEGPQVGTGPAGPDPNSPADPDATSTRLFTVLAGPPDRFGVEGTRVVAGPDGIDVHAVGAPGRDLEVSGVGVARTRLRGAGFDHVARVAPVVPVPAEVELTAVQDVPATVVTVAVHDAVTVTVADYDLDAGELRVAATSSLGEPLYLDGAPLPADGTALTVPLDAPPALVTVTSARGGSGTRPVTLLGAVTAPEPPVVPVLGARRVQQGQRVRLDGTGATDATTFAWVKTRGPAVALEGADTATPSFTAPSRTTVLAFRLTATGPAGEVTVSQQIEVLEPVGPRADIAGPATAVVGVPVRFDGGASDGAATFTWTVDPPVPDPGDGPVLTFPMPAAPTTVTLRVEGPGGPPHTTTVAVAPEPDPLTDLRAEYRTSSSRWRIGGRAAGPRPNTVEAHLAGVRIGGAPVAADGTFDLRAVLTPPGAPDPGDPVTLTSTRGGRAAVGLVLRG